MSKAKETKNLVVGLDIGTSKIAVIVAEIKPDGSFEIIGLGGHPSKGLRKGVVVNIEATVSAIQRALEEAELMADCKISEVLPASRAAISRVSTRAVWSRSRMARLRSRTSSA